MHKYFSQVGNRRINQKKKPDNNCNNKRFGKNQTHIKSYIDDDVKCSVLHTLNVYWS